MFENIRLAFQGIWSHKMRSFLTMLGIIIGIASIIAIVSTIKGTSEQIKDNLIGSGNNTVNVTLSQGDSAYSVDYYDGSSSGSTPILSQSLKDEVLKTDHVENATFFYSRTDYNSSVYYENSSFSGGKVYGIDTNYLNTCGYQVRSGRGFVEADYDNFRKVALVEPRGKQILDTCGGMGYFAASCLDEGVAGMKVGGQCTLIIPPDMGYGARGAGGVIPPNSTLNFEIELISVGR